MENYSLSGPSSEEETTVSTFEYDDQGRVTKETRTVTKVPRDLPSRTPPFNPYTRPWWGEPDTYPKYDTYPGHITTWC